MDRGQLDVFKTLAPCPFCGQKGRETATSRELENGDPLVRESLVTLACFCGGAMRMVGRGPYAECRGLEGAAQAWNRAWALRAVAALRRLARLAREDLALQEPVFSVLRRYQLVDLPPEGEDRWPTS